MEFCIKDSVGLGTCPIVLDLLEHDGINLGFFSPIL